MRLFRHLLSEVIRPSFEGNIFKIAGVGRVHAAYKPFITKIIIQVQLTCE